MFDPSMKEVLGERIVSMDLDTVITGDLRPLFDRPEDFVIYGDTNPRTFYNGSLLLMTVGCRPQVWKDFDPVLSPVKARAEGHFGSDQGWISYRLGPNETKWSKEDGVFSYQVDLLPAGALCLPPEARLVSFHGHVDPWSPEAQRLPWVREHWV
jgi:hypothetical protein